MDVDMKICVLFNSENHCANCPPEPPGRSANLANGRNNP